MHDMNIRLKYFSRILFTCAILFSFFNSMCAQQGNISDRVEKISNQQLFGYCQQIWVVDLASPSADSLVSDLSDMPILLRTEVIKRAIFPFLDDSSRGIAMHYVLCRATKKPTSFGSNVPSNDTAVIKLSYSGLNFYQSRGRYFAATPELLANKEEWRKYFSR